MSKEKDIFPKWKFHKDEIEGKIFKSEEDFKKAGDGWVNSPVLLNQDVKEDVADLSNEKKVTKKKVSKKASKRVSKKVSKKVV
jgi:hypothetical protein